MSIQYGHSGNYAEDAAVAAIGWAALTGQKFLVHYVRGEVTMCGKPIEQMEPTQEPVSCELCVAKWREENDSDWP